MKKYLIATHIVAHQSISGQSSLSLNNPCPHCGSTERRTGAGRGPQEASLHCAGCKRFVRWIAAGDFYVFTETDKKGGES